MNRYARQDSLIGLLRGSTRLATLVLALFLAGTVGTVACAAHDLADAGIGSDTEPTAASHEAGSNEGSPSAGHPSGDCCHIGGHHPPAVLAVVDPVALATRSAAFHGPDVPHTTSPQQRDLRPPIP